MISAFLAVLAASAPTSMAVQIDSAVVREAVAAVTMATRDCYNEALVEEAELAGTMLLRFRVETDGAVAQVERVDSSMHDGRLIDCVLRVIETVRFPFPLSEPVVVVQPFRFIVSTPPGPGTTTTDIYSGR
jgi:hypothetical protein